MSGLYSGKPGLFGGFGLSQFSGLWSGGSGFQPGAFFRLELEDGTGDLLLEDNGYLLLEDAP